jgi:hypothetical protein
MIKSPLQYNLSFKHAEKKGFMKKIHKILCLALTLLLGGLWAYSFSTRIGLFFIAPLWLKVTILAGLGINFGLLAHYFIHKFISWKAADKKKIWLIAIALGLTTLVFILAPYRSVPFRTTHTMQITAGESEVKLVAVLSPDDNLVPREEFQPGEGVQNFDVMGYRLSPGSSINYRRSQTGGLTLAFTEDSGDVALTWDGETHILSPGTLQLDEKDRINGWSVYLDKDTGRTMVTLPGTTWGEPDLFWAVLGALLPVADFITLSSVFAALAWLIGKQRETITQPKFNGAWIKIWLDALICMGLAMLLIKVGFPELMPNWFLLFFLPAMGYLAYRQVDFLIDLDMLSCDHFNNLKSLVSRIDKASSRINQNRMTFWILIAIVAVLGAAAHLQITAPGMGVSGDSVHYMDGALHLASGEGYVRHIAEGDPVVMTGFPPVYPAALVPGIWLGIGIELFARYLNTVLYILTLILTGWIVFKITSKALPAFLAATFTLLSYSIFWVFAWVMSEPLFLVLFIFILLLWFWQVRKPNLWKVLLLGTISGIMLNTRLAAIAYIPVLALGILIYQQTKFKIRLRDAILFGSAALIQPAAFFIRNMFIAERVSESRGLTQATFPLEYWEIIGEEVVSWFKWKEYFTFTHQRFNAMFAGLGVILLLIIAWLIFRKRLSSQQGTDPLTILLLLSIPIYLAVIVLNTVLFTPNQTLSGLTRYMIPVLLTVIILLAKLLSDYWRIPLVFPKVIILFITLVFFLNYYNDAAAFMNQPSPYFRHYTDRKLECGDEVLRIIEELPDTSYYTNSCEYFFFLTGKQCRHLILDESAYEPGGEVYQAVREGSLIAFTPGFGTTPPGIQNYLHDLELIDVECFYEFYRISEAGN